MEIVVHVIPVCAGAGLVILLGVTVGPTLNSLTGRMMAAWTEGQRNAGLRFDYKASDFNLGRVHGWRGELQGALMGCAERLAYFGLLLAGAHVIIAALLALKVASKWQSWTLSGESALGEMKAIRTEIGYVRFILGITLNLLYALIGLGVTKAVAAALGGGI
jgi:hypothetical protein